MPLQHPEDFQRLESEKEDIFSNLKFSVIKKISWNIRNRIGIGKSEKENIQRSWKIVGVGDQVAVSRVALVILEHDCVLDFFKDDVSPAARCNR